MHYNQTFQQYKQQHFVNKKKAIKIDHHKKKKKLNSVGRQGCTKPGCLTIRFDQDVMGWV